MYGTGYYLPGGELQNGRGGGGGQVKFFFQNGGGGLAMLNKDGRQKVTDPRFSNFAAPPPSPCN